MKLLRPSMQIKDSSMVARHPSMKGRTTSKKEKDSSPASGALAGAEIAEHVSADGGVGDKGSGRSRPAADWLEVVARFGGRVRTFSRDMDTNPEVGPELSTADSWHGVRPGMTRAELLEVVRAGGVKLDAADEVDDWILIGDWGMEVYLDEEGAGGLVRQVSLEQSALWGGKEILNVPFHEAMFALQDVARGAGWRPEDGANSEFSDILPLPEAAYTDEELLSEGTVWLPERCIGLAMCDGAVCDLVWRRPQDMPTQFVGGVSEAQMRLSLRPDLAEYLRGKMVERTTSKAVPVQWNPLQTILTLTCVVAMAAIGRLGWKEMQRWQHAQNLPGKITAIEPRPGKPGQSIYRVGFTDPVGKEQTMTLELADFYATPREVGEEVQVAYSAGDPPLFTGPARARDQAFLKYIPWAIGVGGFYCVGSLLLGVGRLRKVPEVASSAPRTES
jgi:hypothetical protein